MIALASPEDPRASTLLDMFFQHYQPRRLRGTSKKNTKLFEVAFNRFARYLNHTPLTSHLTDETIEDFCFWLIDSEYLSPYTANCYRAKLIALWNHLAKLRIVEKFPTSKKIKEPRRIPRAWTKAQIDALFAAFGTLKGSIGNCPADLWWRAIHAVFWDTAERISATLELRWNDLAFDTGMIVSKAENRKGKTEDKAFKLHPETLTLLKSLRNHSRGEKIFEYDCSIGTIYNQYKRLLKAADLPADRHHKFHCMRRSVASYFEVAGGNSTKLLGHSGRQVTERSYLDPTIIEQEHAADKLFRPSQF